MHVNTNQLTIKIVTIIVFKTISDKNIKDNALYSSTKSVHGINIIYIHHLSD